MKLFLLITATTAAAAHYLPVPAKLCYDFDLTLTVTSENFIFASPKFENNFDVTDFITDLTSRSPPKDFETLLPTKVNQTGTYTISSTFCIPKDTGAANRTTVLLATHGLNFDRNYWNSAIEPEKYNFVDYAINQGYSVFYYDRLGVGSSSVASGYQNQLPIQVEIAKQLAHIIRAGKYPGSIGKPKSLVLVGHSFGSSISAGVGVAEPDLADGIILTGFSYNGSNPINFPLAAQLKIASTYDTKKWGKLDTGYLTLVDIYANINTFLKKPDYDIAVAEYADENKQPIAITELLTVSAIELRPLAFKGVAMVIAGQYDFIFCQSNCDDVIGPAGDAAFPNASSFKAVSYPGSGHALNFALNVTGAYQTIFEYLGENGL